ncbi:MAG: acetate/propionate family kinase [Candidatus Omnitrophota bacterium]
MILVINAGSSSIKYSLFAMPQGRAVKQGVITGGSLFRKLEMALSGIRGVSAVGHRVVHGGEDFSRPVLITPRVIDTIRRAAQFAPLHNPANLKGIGVCARILKGAPQVAVFDTAFHQTMPEKAYIYGLPYDYYRRWGVRRYGFHGTSHEYVAREAARLLRRPLSRTNVISCHLGNGVSVTAIRNGSCVDTSMGWTPLEGMIMGTRCGDIDPSLIGYISRRGKMGLAAVYDVLNHKSGLKGVSGISNDMRRLSCAQKQGNRRAALARDIFVYRLRKYIGAYMAVLGRVDMVAFTGGIGEHHPDIRRQATRGLFANLRSRPRVAVLRACEERLIAEKAMAVLRRRIA